MSYIANFREALALQNLPAFPFEIHLHRPNGEEISPADREAIEAEHFTLGQTVDLDASLLTRRKGARWEDRWRPDEKWFASERRRLAAEARAKEAERIERGHVADGGSHWY